LSKSDRHANNAQRSTRTQDPRLLFPRRCAGRAPCAHRRVRNRGSTRNIAEHFSGFHILRGARQTTQKRRKWVM